MMMFVIVGVIVNFVLGCDICCFMMYVFVFLIVEKVNMIVCFLVGFGVMGVECVLMLCDCMGIVMLLLCVIDMYCVVVLYECWFEVEFVDLLIIDIVVDM